MTTEIRKLIGKEVLFRNKINCGSHFGQSIGGVSEVKCSVFKQLSPNEKFVYVSGDSSDHICLGWVEVDNIILEDVLTVDSLEISEINYHSIKPPLGIKPKWLYDEQRLNSLYEAIIRYIDAGMLPSIEWIQEMHELQKDVNSRETRFDHGK